MAGQRRAPEPAADALRVNGTYPPDGEPVELDGEDDDQHEPEPEAGERHAQEGHVISAWSSQVFGSAGRAHAAQDAHHEGQHESVGGERRASRGGARRWPGRRFARAGASRPGRRGPALVPARELHERGLVEAELGRGSGPPPAALAPRPAMISPGRPGTICMIPKETSVARNRTGIALASRRAIKAVTARALSARTARARARRPAPVASHADVRDRFSPVEGERRRSPSTLPHQVAQPVRRAGCPFTARHSSNQTPHSRGMR